MADDKAQSSTDALRVNAKELKRSKFFEILLFRTRLRFRNPKKSASLKDHNIMDGLDCRPFVNSATKADYEINEDLGRCIKYLYSTAWEIKTNKFFSSQVASLALQVSALGVTRGDRATYKDLYDPVLATTFIKNFYSSYLSDVALQNEESGADEYITSIDERNIQQIAAKDERLVFIARPRSGEFDYFISFSKADMLQFSFRLIINPKHSRELGDAATQQALNFSHALVNSLTIEFLEAKEAESLARKFR